jgi:hypothetical protein
MAGIGWAVDTLRQGVLVHRQGWNGRGMYLALAGSPAAVLSDGSDVDLRPHVVMRTVDGTFVPWTCSQTDLLANDWQAATVDIP